MDISLPAFLQERIIWLGDKLLRDRLLVAGGTADQRGEFVCYWMHHAVRGHENPALDVAIHHATMLKMPLLVYHAICEEYPYASDRHHAFMLQGARDVQRELADLGVRYVFHLQRESHRGPHLRELAKRAAVLVTESMPVEPIVGWIERIQSACSTPIAVVDCACIVPLTLTNKGYTRAYEFRDATKSILEQRLAHPYPHQPVTCEPYYGPLPFYPLNLQDADLRELIGKCKIDHTVGPVIDSPGGSRAGYVRWEIFKSDALRRYAKRRNNAADQNGVSRLSAYLHFGMTSPFRIAREAAEHQADKFLDELLVWRELAFHFCFHQQQPLDSIERIPEWARRSLELHRSDLREQNYSWESLARGKTCSSLWNACQRSLLKHGELHNNLRMTWGKAMLSWTDSAERALHMMIDLNHRYALDGRDPSSYGGLLWCMGQFDRPFEPEIPVFGHVRPRSLIEHEKRIDMGKYVSLVDRSIAVERTRVAVVGAGIAGLVAARTLSDHGLDVHVFDKSRGIGGRMATRRIDDVIRFDHGAQYFTARDERFTRQVHSWIHDGIVAPWHGRVVQLNKGEVVAEKSSTSRYVATPGMSSLGRHLAIGLNVTCETLVKELRPTDDKYGERWHLLDESESDLGGFDYVIVNAPPAQSLPLLRPHSPLAMNIEPVTMSPCWSLMIQVETIAAIPFDAAFVDDSSLAWICRNDTKPGRAKCDPACWVLHASAKWSTDHLESSAEDVTVHLQQAFAECIGVGIAKLRCLAVHQWRYAIPATTLDRDCIWDPATKLGACGDWCGGPRVEGAYLSGAAIAGSLLRDMTIDRRASSAKTEYTGQLF